MRKLMAAHIVAVFFLTWFSYWFGTSPSTTNYSEEDRPAMIVKAG